MFKPSSIASRILVSEIHNADKLERVTNAIELVEVSRLNGMNDKDIVSFVDNFVSSKNKAQASIIKAIIIFEENFNLLTDSEV